MPQFDRGDEGRQPFMRPRQDMGVTPGAITPPAAMGAPTPAAPQYNFGTAAPATPSYDFGSFEMPSFGGSSAPGMHFTAAPNFTAPEFMAPSYEDMLNSPGYQARLQEGQKNLEASAAARGLLRTGGTLKDILRYGQDYAANEYANVYNRALQGFDRNYQGAKDEFAPQLASWEMQNQMQQQRDMAEYQRQMDLYGIQNDNSKWQEMLRFQLLNQPAPVFPGQY